MAINKNLTLTL